MLRFVYFIVFIVLFIAHLLKVILMFCIINSKLNFQIDLIL